MEQTEKAIVQLIIAHGIVENNILESEIEAIRKDFRNEKARPLRESFIRINVKLRKLSLEIKSIIKSKCVGCESITNIRAAICEGCSDPLARCEWVQYHGIVNNEEDFVSKEVGTELKPEEIRFFSGLTQKLLERNYVSTDEIYSIRNDKWSHSDTDVVLEKLRAKCWLQRDDRSFWEIGIHSSQILEVSHELLSRILITDRLILLNLNFYQYLFGILGLRTHLELRSFIETSVKNLERDDGNAEVAERNIAEQLAKLPGITTY